MMPTLPPLSWTHQSINRIEAWSKQSDWSSHLKAVSMIPTVPVIALAEASKLAALCFAGTAGTLSKKTASWIGLSHWFPECFPVWIQAWRVVHVLALVAEAVVATITSPLAIIKPTLIVKGSDLLHVRDTWEPSSASFSNSFSTPPSLLLPLPQPLVAEEAPIYVSPKANESSSFARIWIRAREMYATRPTAVKAVLAGTSIAAAIGVGYAIYQGLQTASQDISIPQKKMTLFNRYNTCSIEPPSPNTSPFDGESPIEEKIEPILKIIIPKDAPPYVSTSDAAGNVDSPHTFIRPSDQGLQTASQDTSISQKEMTLFDLYSSTAPDGNVDSPHTFTPHVKAQNLYANTTLTPVANVTLLDEMRTPSQESSDPLGLKINSSDQELQTASQDTSISQKEMTLFDLYPPSDPDGNVDSPYTFTPHVKAQNLYANTTLTSDYFPHVSKPSSNRVEMPTPNDTFVNYNISKINTNLPGTLEGLSSINTSLVLHQAGNSTAFSKPLNDTFHDTGSSEEKSSVLKLALASIGIGLFPLSVYLLKKTCWPNNGNNPAAPVNLNEIAGGAPEKLEPPKNIPPDVNPAKAGDNAMGIIEPALENVAVNFAEDPEENIAAVGVDKDVKALVAIGNVIIPPGENIPAARLDKDVEVPLVPPANLLHSFFNFVGIKVEPIEPEESVDYTDIKNALTHDFNVNEDDILTTVNRNLNAVKGEFIHSNLMAEGTEPISYRISSSNEYLIEFNTTKIPEDVMDTFQISVTIEDEFYRIHLDETSTGSPQACANAIFGAIEKIYERREAQVPLNEENMSFILKSLWRKGATKGLYETAQNFLNKDLQGVSLETRGLGPIFLDINLTTPDNVIVSHTFNRQLAAIGHVDGEAKMRLYDSFSTWKLTASMRDPENKLNAEQFPDPKNAIRVSFTPFKKLELPQEAAVMDREPIKASNLDDQVQLADNPGFIAKLFNFNDHVLKQAKYGRALQTMIDSLMNVKESKIGVGPHVKIVLDFAKNQAKDMTLEIRSVYRCFLDRLRACIIAVKKLGLDAINSAQFKPILNVVRARFLNNHMFEYCQELVFAAMVQSENDKPEELCLLPIEQQCLRISKMRSELGASKAGVGLGKVQGYLNYQFDPHRKTNTPYANYTFILDGIERTNLRFGTPTWEGWVFSAELVPEFDLFIHTLETNKENYCYFNLQNRVFKFPGNESGRCRAIEERAKNSEHFFVATYAHDSSFYKQKGDIFGVEQMETDAFIDHFVDQMFVKKNGYHFSKNLLDRGLEEKVKRIVQTVRNGFFPEDASLTIDQRKAFIQLTYAFMTLEILRLTGAKYYNLSCKDAIDRGGINSSILFFLVGLLTGEINKDVFDLFNANLADDQKAIVEQAKAFMVEHSVITHAAALIVKKQAIIESRLAYLILCLEILKIVTAEQARAIYNDLGFMLTKPKVCRHEEYIAKQAASQPPPPVDEESIIERCQVPPPSIWQRGWWRPDVISVEANGSVINLSPDLLAQELFKDYAWESRLPAGITQADIAKEYLFRWDADPAFSTKTVSHVNSQVALFKDATPRGRLRMITECIGRIKDQRNYSKGEEDEGLHVGKPYAEAIASWKSFEKDNLPTFDPLKNARFSFDLSQEYELKEKSPLTLSQNRIVNIAHQSLVDIHRISLPQLGLKDPQRIKGIEDKDRPNVISAEVYQFVENLIKNSPAGQNLNSDHVDSLVAKTLLALAQTWSLTTQIGLSHVASKKGIRLDNGPYPMIGDIQVIGDEIIVDMLNRNVAKSQNPGFVSALGYFNFTNRCIIDIKTGKNEFKYYYDLAPPYKKPESKRTIEDLARSFAEGLIE